ncbi:MAG: hypothetical protein ACK55Z_30515, partial [bacterium]
MDQAHRPQARSYSTLLDRCPVTTGNLSLIYATALQLDPIAARRNGGSPRSLVMLFRHTMTKRSIMTHVCLLIMFIVVLVL